jgi:hypothetical protein
MSHNSITHDYLDTVLRNAPPTSEVLDAVRDSTLDTTFLGRLPHVLPDVDGGWCECRPGRGADQDSVASLPNVTVNVWV